MSNWASHRFFLYGMLFMIGVVWGLTFSIAKIIASEGAHPIGLSFWQVFSAAGTLFIVCAIRNSFPKWNMLSLRHYLVVGITGSIIPGTIYFYAASRVDASILAMTTTLVPLLIYGISLALKIDAYSRRRTLGILLGFVAILLLVLPDSSLPSRSATLWLILAFVSTVFYAVESIYVDMFIAKDADMIALLLGGLIVASVGLLPIALVQDAWVPVNLPFGQIEWLILAMGVVSSIAYSAYFVLVKLAGAVFASLSGYLMTIAGVFWGVAIFGESHSMWVWFGFVVLLVAMGLVTPREADAPEK
ncbi:MAG: drug/metabolite transporter (DMT)-like permease [Saprospiraceae bacterium]|jgi:drug/metabolite transporter (DMT)-like permease